MRYDYGSEQLSDITQDIEVPEGVCFDPDNITLEGWYADELSAHRAKRGWCETFENYFLLDPDLDYTFSIANSPKTDHFVLCTHFHTACARYAFWRLTNGQAPEAQYAIETSHIPNAESCRDKFLSAPDMCPNSDQPLILGGPGEPPRLNSKWFDWVKDVIEKIKSSSD